jgi:PAS domain S-box-containing protein
VTYSVLYVDDEPALLDIGKVFLEASGEFAVATVPSVESALSAMTTQHFDAIISDYQMPETNGLTFLKKIRADKNPIPFIIFTGQGREEIVIEAINAGADFYLQKGGAQKAQFAELAHKIKKAIELKKALHDLHDSEKKFRMLIENSFDGIIITTPTGDILFANNAAKEMAGAGSVDEIIGKMNVYDFIAPSSKDEVMYDYKMVAGGTEGYISKYNIFNLKHEGMLVECIGKTITFQDAPAILVSLRDITDRHHS